MWIVLNLILEKVVEVRTIGGSKVGERNWKVSFLHGVYSLEIPQEPISAEIDRFMRSLAASECG